VAVSALVVAGTTALLLAVGPRLSVAQRTSGERAALAALTRDPVLLRLAVVFAASFGLSVVVGNWVVTLLEKTAGLSSAQADVLGTATLVLASGSPPLALAGACAVGLAAGIPFATPFTEAATRYRTSPATAVGFVNGTGAFTVLALTPLVGIAFSRDAGVAAFVVLAVLWALGGLALPRHVAGEAA
jgi:hypothetical protein